jgi:hypothetical protein
VGLFTALITLPLAPVRGVVWVAEQLAEQAERELFDPETVRRQLMAIELSYEDGQISEEQRDRAQDELLERLAIIEQRQQAYEGMA